VTPNDAARYADAIMLDALTIRARLAATLDHIDQSAGGYPSSTSGADRSSGGPRTIDCGTPDDPDPLPVTSVEATVLSGRPDTALQARQSIETELRALSDHATRLARLVSNWWTPGTEAGRNADAAARLSLDSYWCDNHRRHGVFEARAEQRRRCLWCDDIRLNPDYREEPDKELIDQRQRHGRLTSRDYEAFAIRIRDRKRTRKGAKAVIAV
jgi:hypothetical protein